MEATWSSKGMQLRHAGGHAMGECNRILPSDEQDGWRWWCWYTGYFGEEEGIGNGSSEAEEEFFANVSHDLPLSALSRPPGVVLANEPGNMPEPPPYAGKYAFGHQDVGLVEDLLGWSAGAGRAQLNCFPAACR